MVFVRQLCQASQPRSINSLVQQQQQQQHQSTSSQRQRAVTSATPRVSSSNTAFLNSSSGQDNSFSQLNSFETMFAGLANLSLSQLVDVLLANPSSQKQGNSLFGSSSVPITSLGASASSSSAIAPSLSESIDILQLGLNSLYGRLACFSECQQNLISSMELNRLKRHNSDKKRGSNLPSGRTHHSRRSQPTLINNQASPTSNPSSPSIASLAAATSDQILQSSPVSATFDRGSDGYSNISPDFLEVSCFQHIIKGAWLVFSWDNFIPQFRYLLLYLLFFPWTFIALD
ncbi:unnamed protein product [Protopolystoma xenopodis]|uniref:Uncharacterized protein n=1 Tax=Protopolystoma xenopodis TaxID=117903 RepID=A0A3S5FE56_9PLAT|nr:unnamed protein product [Protopolystoma xenopodis]